MGLKWVTLRRDDRIQELRDLFDAQALEFREDNLPTQISTFFEDVLAAFPEGARECNIEGLFENVLREWR